MQDTEREKLKKFVSLRQDLERVRNLCYIIISHFSKTATTLLNTRLANSIP